MQATEERVQPEFQGNKATRDLANQLFDATIATARFYGQKSSIAVSLDAFAAYIASAEGGNADEVRTRVESALSENDHVFLREERESGVFFVTTRSGLSPVKEGPADQTHTFAKRFEDPKPIPQELLHRRKAKSMAEASDLASTDSEASVAELSDDVDLADELAADDLTQQATPESKAKPTPPADVITDLDEATDEELAEALRVHLAYDYAVAHFGDQWMAEESVPRLSRGDLRRIRDYILEQERPVSDDEIVQDVLGIRQSATEYDLQCFAVNFRLSRETRDFEFVGIAGAHFWSTSGIDTPSVAKRKPAEVGQDYRVLLDLTDEATTVDDGVIEHVLTFYEHQHGVLPYDAAFQSIISGPVLEGQRSAIVTFESPLTYQSFRVEVRFPTGNRGGYLAGFADFFVEHLVPGAFLTIEASEKPGTFTIEFLTVSGQDRKLLALDAKKKQYKFEPQTFYCAPNEDMLLTENRFPKIAGTSPLDERTRRQPEKVLVHAFQYVGENVDAESNGQLMAVIDELLSAANIERPVPAELIRQIASSDNYPEFSIDPEADDVIYFTPGSTDDTSS